MTSRAAFFVVAVLLSTFATTSRSDLSAQGEPAVRRAVTGDTAETTPEISTEELERVLSARSAIVVDARPPAEFGMGHIPGAVNVAAKPGMPIAQYVSDVTEIGRLVSGNRAAALVLYCNGMHCGKTKRLAAELRDDGYTSVRP